MSSEKKGLNIGVKSFITAIVVIFILMICTYGLTFIVPGAYMPFWKWALSPFLVLGSEGNGSLIAVLIFLLHGIRIARSSQKKQNFWRY